MTRVPATSRRSHLTRRRVGWLRLRALLGTALLVALIAGADRRPVAGSGTDGAEEAYFQFDYPPYPQTFIFKLTDPDRIREAREMLNGQRRSRHVSGTILKQPAAYNPPWSYTLDPSTIGFFDFATEVCDATIQEVEARLDAACGAFLPGCTWCPWGSRLIAELPPPTQARPLYLPLAMTGPRWEAPPSADTIERLCYNTPTWNRAAEQQTLWPTRSSA